MSHRKANINEKDNSFSILARALALPVRVQIVRLIIENGFTINRENLYVNDFARETINKHLGELRSLGVLKMEGNKGHITYNIDESWFTQMMTEFLNFFGKCISMPQPEIIDHYSQLNTPPVNEIKEDKPLLVYPHFGAFIKRRREELHITQENFARKIRMDRGQLSRIECGKTAIKIHKLKAVSTALYFDYQNLKKEYYSYQLAEMIDESGCDDSILLSARAKLNQHAQPVHKH